jgi:hypothetical protein
MFCNDDYPDFPYSLSGSCFVFRYGRHHYMATADHVVAHRAPEDVLIHAREDYTDDSLPFDKRVNVQPSSSIPAAAADVALFRICGDKCTEEQLRIVGALDLAEWRPRVGRRPREGDPHLVTGYPFATKWIKYEDNRFSQGRVITDGKYSGASPDGTTQFLAVPRMPAIEDLNGLSGAPVFGIQWQGNRYSFSHFAGLVIERTAINNEPTLPWEVRFISSSIVYAALDRAEAE